MHICSLYQRATRHALLFLLLLGLLLPGGRAGAADLHAITEINPPCNFEIDGQTRGIAVDLLLRMTERAGIELAREDIDVWPWARGYEEIQQGGPVLLFAMARRPQREELFQWIGPIMELRTSVFTLRGSGITVDDPVEAVRRYRVGTMRDSASEQYLLRRGAPRERLESVHDRMLNILKLRQRHIDLMVANEPATYYSLKELGIPAAEIEPVYELMSSPLYYAASKQMDAETVNRLQAALDALRAEGEVDRIINSYR